MCESTASGQATSCGNKRLDAIPFPCSASTTVVSSPSESRTSSEEDRLPVGTRVSYVFLSAWPKPEVNIRPWPRKAPPIECFILSVGLFRCLDLVLSTNADLGEG